MAIISRSGSLTSSSTLIGELTPVTTEDVLDQTHFVRNPTVEKTSFNPSDYPLESRALAGYTQGHRIIVTYFLQVVGGDEKRTNVIDSSTERHNIHTPYTLIRDFELTLQDPLTFTYDDTLTEGAINGEATIYPGVNPVLGDVFIYEIGDGLRGLFKVTNVNALSWRQDRMHRITFTLYKYVTDELYQSLIDSVVRRTVFDKKTYLTNNATLLLEDEYTHLIALRQFRTQLIKYYFRTFYSNSMASIIHPSGVYDPYVTEYLMSKITFNETGVRPKQLYHSVDDTYDMTLWARLQDRLMVTLYGLRTYYRHMTRDISQKDVSITTLANRPYLLVEIDPDPVLPLDPKVHPGYVLTEAFYTGDVSRMTSLEQLVYISVTTRKIPDKKYFIDTFLGQYQTLTKEEQFYYIPLYIHLIDASLAMVVTPKYEGGLL